MRAPVFVCVPLHKLTEQFNNGWILPPEPGIHHQSRCLTQECAATHLLWVRRCSSQDLIPTNTKTATDPSGHDATSLLLTIRSLSGLIWLIRSEPVPTRRPMRDCDTLMVSSKSVRQTIVGNSSAAALAQCKHPHWIFIAVMESHTEHVVSYVFLHPASSTEGISIVMPSLNANFHHNKWNNGSRWSPSRRLKWFNGTNATVLHA